jgi:hypothetical protein
MIVAPVTGSVDAAGTTLAQGDVRLEEAGVQHPALVAGSDGAQLVLIVADRRALSSALDDGTVAGALGPALSKALSKLLRDLRYAASA